MRQTKLFSWLVLALLSIMSFPKLGAQNVITMTTAKQKGDIITLGLNPEGGFVVEGATKSTESDYIITALDGKITISGYVTVLLCTESELTELDLSKSTSLIALDCSGNNLSTLDVSKNTELIYLGCASNNLTTLNLQNNKEIGKLICYLNNLTELDITHNTKLTDLQCYGNRLSLLDVSKNIELNTLDCSGNQLTALDLTANTNLIWLSCSANRIMDDSMDALIASLPVRGGEMDKSLFQVINKTKEEFNVCTPKQVEAATARGWRAQEWRYNRWTDYAGEEAVERVKINFNTPTNGAFQVSNHLGGAVSSGQTVEKGTSITIFAMPDEGYEIESLTINGERLFDQNFDENRQAYVTIYQADKDTNIVIRFKQKGAPTPQMVAITYEQPMNGSLEIKNGEESIASDALVEKGTTLSIIATANKGYELKGGKVLVGETEVTLVREGLVYTGRFTVDKSVTIAAEFVQATALTTIDTALCSLYPNPATEWVRISNATPYTEVVLYGLDGATLMTTTTNAEGEATLNVSAFAKGNYLVTVGTRTMCLILQ